MNNASARPWPDRALGIAAWSAFALVTLVFAWILGDVLMRGAGQLSWSFLVEAPARSGRSGGIGPVIVATALIVGVCVAVAAPLGVGTAILLSEFSRGRSAFGRAVRYSLDVLAAVPSIVFGLFGNAFFCVALGMGFSILSGGLTLACMVLPLVIRSVEAGLRAVPDDYRQAGAALALSKTTLISRVLLPAAMPALAASLILGVGRALAETAALIFTSGYVDRMPESLYDSGRALSIHIYDLAMNVPGGEPRGAASALVLAALLLIINAAAALLASRFGVARGFAQGTGGGR